MLNYKLVDVSEIFVENRYMYILVYGFNRDHHGKLINFYSF